MALNDIVKEIETFQRLAGALKSTEHFDRKQAILEYMKDVLKKNDFVLALYEDGFERSPQTMSSYLNMMASIHQKTAIDATRAKELTVLEKLAGDNPEKTVLPSLAFQIFGKSKKYVALAKAVENRDMVDLMNHYIDENDPIGTAVMQYFEPETFLRIAQLDLAKMQQEFMQKNFFDEKKKEGEQTLVYNSKKVVRYVAENLEKIDKQKQDGIYFELAKQCAKIDKK